MNEPRSALLLLSMIAVLSSGVIAASPVASIVEIENGLQSGGSSRSSGDIRRFSYAPRLFPVVTVFHDGSVDLFDIGQRVRPELGWLASEGYVAPLVESLRAEHPEAVINMITNSPNGSGPFGDLEALAREQNLDPSRHRFFSYVARVGPSDDAFVGNDDPLKFEVFDSVGAYKGPVVVSVRGGDVLDAGVKQNDEQDLLFFARFLVDVGSGVAEDQPVRVHPGFNGSRSNPDGQPVGIIGVASPTCATEPDSLFCFHMDPIDGDFTRPGHVLARLRVTSGLDGSFGGFWYDHLRSGEGFNVSIFEGNPQSMAVAWYTYDPQGNPLYLSGVGDVQHRFAEIEMVSTSGGAMASTDNPANVVREPWGTIRLGFVQCNVGRVFYEPLSDAYPTGDYFITRATPQSVGADGACGLRSLQLYGVPDNHWMTPEGIRFLEPDPGPSE